MELFISIAVLVISANIDTFVLMLPFGVSHVRICAKNIFLIAGITSAFTYMSMKVGTAFSQMISLQAANLVGGLTLVLIGLYFVLKFCVHQKKKEQEDSGNVSGLQMQEERVMSTVEAVVLALVLSINNAGIGIAAGIAYISEFYVSVATFLCTWICIKLGLLAGKSLMGRLVTKYSVFLSGILLLALGVYECLGF